VGCGFTIGFVNECSMSVPWRELHGDEDEPPTLYEEEEE
jgi:hypothetical protein